MDLPRSRQVTRLVKALRAEKVDVVCASTTDLDNSINVLGNGAVVHRIPNLESSSWKKRVGRVLPVFRPIPDRQVPWAREATQYVQQSLGLQQNDCLVTFGHPMSDHLVGLELKKTSKCAWIAHFSDPWPHSLHQFSSGPAARKSRMLYKEISEHADLLVFTNSTAARLCTSWLPDSAKAKSRVLNHSFATESEFPMSLVEERGDSEPPILRYLGSLYGRRTGYSLLRALRRIEKKSLLVDRPFRVQLIGHKSRFARLVTWYFNRKLESLECCPPVSYQDSFRLMAGTDALISIDADTVENPFVASKLVEYLPFRKPILGISPPGAARELLQSIGAFIASPKDKTAVVEAVTQLVNFLYEGGAKDCVIPQMEALNLEQFSSERVALNFTGLIDEARISSSAIHRLSAFKIDVP